MATTITRGDCPMTPLNRNRKRIGKRAVGVRRVTVGLVGLWMSSRRSLEGPPSMRKRRTPRARRLS